MKLYRVTVVTPTSNIDRSVWVDHLDSEGHSLVFMNGEEIVAVFPAALTMITNVETKEQYEARTGKTK